MKSDREKENNRCISLHMHNLHQRLHHSLNLGTRRFDEKTNRWRWQCANIEVQRQVLRSIDAFLDSISGDSRASHHPLVKDSVADVVGALLWILLCRSGPLLSLAANVAVKSVILLPNSVLESYVLDLINPLSSLVSTHQIEVAIPCATALNMVISNVSAANEKATWDTLKETECVPRIVRNIKDFCGDVKKIEYFGGMASLLSTILWRWPPSRFPVWNDFKLMKVIAGMHTEISIRVAVLKLYTSLALCGTVAKRLIESGEGFVEVVVQSMGKSHSHVVRIEGFKLAQCLLRSQENCLKVMNCCGEALVEAIICGMGEISLHSRKLGNYHMPLLEEACQLALVTRWAGKHHISFWKKGIDKVLLNLLVEDIQAQSYGQVLTLEKQISIAKEGLKTNYHIGLRGYVWDILGWLAVHCVENFKPETHGSELHINLLVTCACFAFVDAIKKWCRVCQIDVDDNYRSEPASRAVLMMICSPCIYIASQARFILSALLSMEGMTCLKNVIHTLDYTSSLASYGTSDKLQLVINLIGLTCFSSSSQYQRSIIESKGIKAVVHIVKRCLRNEIFAERLTFASHLHTTFQERICCWICAEDWEGTNILLFYGLWGLAELVHQCGSSQENLAAFTSEVAHIEAQLVSELLEICSCSSYSPGLRWYAGYILSYYGFYGFPNENVKRIGKSLNDKEYADMQLVVSNGDSLCVHGVILSVRCPSLLPPEVVPVEELSSLSSKEPRDKVVRDTTREIRLSAHVDYEALVKLLEYVYLGCLHAGEETTKKLKVLAKRCNLQPLLHMLHRRSPKWGTFFPSPDFTSCLGSAGISFWDVILESKADKLVGWACNICSHSLPHMHVHKVILQSVCDYLKALFHSGMQESQSQFIEVPISWEAMVKLVHWFYSNELLNPPSGCLWDNMDDVEKLSHLQPYLELCWLAEFWVMEDVQEACWNVIISWLDSAKHLSSKIIKMAADLFLWKLVDIAANHMAPSYRQLLESGELEELDDSLVHLIYSSSVQLSQESGNRSR